MNRLITSLSIALAVSASAVGQNPAQVDDIVRSYMPGTAVFASPKMLDASVNDKARTVDITLDGNAYNLPLTPGQLDEMKDQIRLLLPESQRNYKVNIFSDTENLDSLTLFAPKKYVRPTEKTRFVTPLNGRTAPRGLDGSNIALWQSHGLYYQGRDEWGWQRPRLWQTCEDLYTQSYVIPFLMPMLENAGAYVMSPRERDVNTLEYIIDNDSPASIYTELQAQNPWSDTDKPGFAYAGGYLYDYDNPFTSGTARIAKTVKDASKASAASWNTRIDRDDTYAVYVSYQTLPNSATDAEYTVNAANGPHKFRINQRMGGGTWIYLGHFPLKAGVSELPIVQLTNLSKDKNAVITADAVKIGGGMGNVARHPLKGYSDTIQYDYNVSGYPRFDEGARYWLQWAGAPDSVYSATGYENEYNDDYRSRGYWVNWLAGGSSVLPKQEGLGIPVDLSFAFHSDAGITRNDSVIGTLGIYCTDNQKSYPNGTSRLAARDLTNSVMTEIVADVRAAYEPKWTRRHMWNRSYAEARVPAVPAMLLELLSHQNFADMRYGLDPTFRFTVSRAIYKGMLKYLANRDGRPYVVQPLPVRAFAISGGSDGAYTLSWAERVDSLEPTATPTYYIVEHRQQGGMGFAPIATVTSPEYRLTVSDNDIHSYRIIAGNEGGVSFPSEVLALRYLPGDRQAMIVNGFTRISAPDWIDYGDYRGFTDETDPGVPYVQDISYVGAQFEMRRDIPWMANETAGLGASRPDYEDKVIAGNTFDYVALHGDAIAKAGYGFTSSSVEAFADDASAPSKCVIDLILGTQKETQVGAGAYGTRYKAFTTPLQQRLSACAQAGCGIMVSGAYIATDLWCNPFSSDETLKADQQWAKAVLGFTWRSGKATDDDAVEGIKNHYGLFAGLKFTFSNQLNYDSYAVKSPGAIAPADKDAAEAVLRYVSGHLPAGTAYAAPTHRTVSIGIPFESITSQPVRDQMMSQILDFLR